MNTGSRHRQVGSRARARLSSQEEKRNRYEYLVVFGFSEQYRLANIVEDGRVRRVLEGSSSLLYNFSRKTIRYDVKIAVRLGNGSDNENLYS